MTATRVEFGVTDALVPPPMLGLLLRAALERSFLPAGERSSAQLVSGRASRVAASLGLGLLAGLLNPRGIDTHLVFLRSSPAGAMWGVVDDFAHFDPFAYMPMRSGAQSLLSWLTTDALFLLCGVALLFGTVRFLRAPSARTLATIDPVHVGLAMAGFVAMAVAIRFQWLAVFPLLFLLHSARSGLAERPLAARSLSYGLAALTLALALAYPAVGGFPLRAKDVPSSRETYLEMLPALDDLLATCYFLDDAQYLDHVFE